MKFATYTYDDGGVKTGIVVGDTIIYAGIAGSMTDLISRWEELRPQLEARAGSGVGRPLASVTFCAPVPKPSKIWAIGLNCADHIAESKVETPARQVWFTKAQTSINRPHDPILIAKGSQHVDYAVELVAVIGKRGKHIAAERAAEHVFCYCVGNDVTERIWQHATPQWSLGKSFDTPRSHRSLDYHGGRSRRSSPVRTHLFGQR